MSFVSVLKSVKVLSDSCSIVIVMLLLTRLSADQKGQAQLGLFKELSSGFSSSVRFVALEYQHLPIGMGILCPSAPL